MQNIPTNNFWSCAFNTYGTLSMFLLSVQINFYIILSSYIEGHVKQNSSLNFMSLVGFPASEIWMFFFWKFTAEQVLKLFWDRKNSLKPPVFDFPIGFHMACKNQESWDLWLVGFWVNRNSKMKKFWIIISSKPQKFCTIDKKWPRNIHAKLHKKVFKIVPKILQNGH